MRIRVAVVLGVVACLLFVGAPASAGIWDPQDTGGPFDLRWLGVSQVRPMHELRIVIGFWPGFRRGDLTYYGTYDEGGIHGVRVEFILADGTRRYGFVVRRKGAVRFYHGDFGSSSCCFASRFVRIGPTTFSAKIFPFWIRNHENVNAGLRYRAVSQICHNLICRRDHTRLARI